LYLIVFEQPARRDFFSILRVKRRSFNFLTSGPA